MRTTLFRKEAIDHQRERLVGEIVIANSLSKSIVVIVIVTLFLLFLLFLIFGSYSRKVHVQGQLIPKTGLVNVYPQYSGILKERMVNTGDMVRKGDPLVSVFTGRRDENGIELTAAIVKSLEQQTARLNDEIERISSQHLKKKEYLKELLRNKENQISQIEGEIGLQQKILDLSNNRYKLLKTIENKELLSKDELEQNLEKVLAQEKVLESLKLARLQAISLGNEYQYNLSVIETEKETKLTEINNQIYSLRRTLIEQENVSTYTIFAPVDGRVSTVQIHMGQQTETGKPIMAIIPQDAEFIAEIFIPTYAMGFVETGLPVELRYDAFAYQRFGSYPGEITDISKTLLAPNQISTPLPINEPVYLSRAALLHNKIQAYGKEFPLQAGMRFEATVLLDKQPVYVWLLQPFYSLKGSI